MCQNRMFNGTTENYPSYSVNKSCGYRGTHQWHLKWKTRWVCSYFLLMLLARKYTTVRIYDNLFIHSSFVSDFWLLQIKSLWTSHIHLCMDICCLYLGNIPSSRMVYGKSMFNFLKNCWSNCFFCILLSY